MSQQLTISREHLAGNRRMIIARSIAASMAGVFPVPVVEEWMSSSITRSMVKRIAESHAVDMDDAAIRMIADGPESPPSWTELAGGTLMFKMVGRAWRRLLITYVVAKRTQAAARYFQINTLFDHYCARLHVGMGLDAKSAEQLRTLIGAAIDQTPGNVGNDIFRRSAMAAAKATVRAPLNLLDTVSGGFVRKLLSRGSDEVEAIAEVDHRLDTELQHKRGFLARTTAAVELQLSTTGNPYVEELVDNFERLWREHPGESHDDERKH